MDQPYEWRPVGGHLALDLVNTVSWRSDPQRRIERLGTPGAVVDWAATLGTLDRQQASRLRRAVEDDPEEAARLHSQVLALRTAVAAVLDASVDSHPAGADVIQEVRSAWERSLPAAELAPELPLRWLVRPRDLRSLGDLLGLAAGDLLRSGDVSQVRRCDGPGCGWFFLDRTRNHSRRWCDAGDCGNRVRGQRHRAKATHGAGG